MKRLTSVCMISPGLEPSPYPSVIQVSPILVKSRWDSPVADDEGNISRLFVKSPD